MIALPRIALLLCISIPCSATCVGDQRSYFHEQVEKVLRSRCFECHSHATGNIEGNLALDWRSGWELGGDRGPALVPGKPEQSLLIRAIRHQDSELRMPAEKLSEQEISILTRWIEQGAFDDRVARPMQKLQTETGGRSSHCEVPQSRTNLMPTQSTPLSRNA